MRYFEMSLQDSRAIFDQPENFPLTVTVNGETRKLTKPEVEQLRKDRVNFDVDEAQAALLLIKFGTC